MTTLTMQLPPDAVDLDEFEEEVVTAISDRLRDERGFKRTGSLDDRDSQRAYELAPSGAIVVMTQGRQLTVRLREIDVDARDLFTGVSSEL
jgi:hypothetical protein